MIDRFRASFQQERLWILEALVPDKALYTMSRLTRLIGKLDVGALQRAIQEVIRRHESIRTRFVEQDGKALQQIGSESFQLSVRDLSAFGTLARESELEQQIQVEVARPFNLEMGPLLRVSLWQLAPEEHMLLLCMHHIVSDDWSQGILARELSAFYAAILRGEPLSLPPLPVQYADYAIWQREWLCEERLKRELTYWIEQLRGVPELLELPTDRPRPAVESHRGATHRFAVPAELSERLRALARAEGATLYMVLLAAFSAMLWRYTGQYDMVVGTPIAGRGRPELEHLIGFFVNTLALRINCSGDLTVRDLIAQVRATALAAYEHQELPFDRLVEALQPARSLAHSPVFQVLFALDNTPTVSLSFVDMTTLPEDVESRSAKFDLSLLLTDRGEELSGMWEYATDLFDAETISRWAGHFERLLAEMAVDPDQQISELPLLGEEERRLVLTTWNTTDSQYQIGQCVHELVESQAARTPEAVAVMFADEQITYRELDESANQLAHYIRELGVGPDVLVGVFLERSIEMAITLLGVLKAGGAYVPLDPTYPTSRLEYMLQDSAARVVVTQSTLAATLPDSAAQVVLVDLEAERIGRGSRQGFSSGALPTNLAYVIYTSGSTGKPKGVAMPHRALVNLLNWQVGDWRVPAPVRTLQFATINFDASFHEFFSSWSTGGAVVMVTEELRHDHSGLLKSVDENGVQRLFMPCVALRDLAELAEAHGATTRTLGEIQTAGEQLRLTIPIRNWLRTLGAPLYNHYGPSETHVVTSHTLEGDPFGWPVLPPIGTPIANTSCYVLDSHLQPCPIGIPGELYIGGVQLARGYLNRPALTADRFVPDPFSGRPSARLYRTGDSVRWRANRQLEFLGRLDDQVKLRGFRVEPGEVEAVLSDHPAVVDAVVVLRRDATIGPYLAGYVTCIKSHNGTIISSAELREWLQKRLPEYMVPTTIVALAALPLTPSGKVNRLALPTPDRGATAAESYVAPRTPLEEFVTAIWVDILGLPNIGIRDDFFALGGHSLLATQVISRLQHALGIDLALRAFFEAPTIAQLSRAAEEALVARVEKMEASAVTDLLKVSAYDHDD